MAYNKKKKKPSDFATALTSKQRRFCELYLRYDKDEIRAYVKAGYSSSKKNLATAARRLLENPKVERYIDELADDAPDLDDLGKLSPRQALFVIEYLQDFNAGKAYKRSRYGKSKKANMANTAWSVLRNPAVKKALANIIRRRFKFLRLTESELLTQLARIIMFDPRDLYNEDGSLKQITELDDDAVAALQSMEVLPQKDKKGKYVEVKKINFASRIKAIELYGKYLSMWQDNINLNANVKAGVLVVPGTQDQWSEVVKAQNQLLSQRNAINKDEGQVIDLK